MPTTAGINIDLNIKSTGGAIIAYHFEDLLDGSINKTLTEAGVITNSTRLWSFSGTDGSLHGWNCSGGTTNGSSNSDGSQYGRHALWNNNTYHWINSSWSWCNVNNNLLCVAK